jgi:hypothetical protein
VGQHKLGAAAARAGLVDQVELEGHRLILSGNNGWPLPDMSGLFSVHSFLTDH